ncbi:hypothetical protein ACH4KO_09735 [Streptomyces anulatus]
MRRRDQSSPRRPEDADAPQQPDAAADAEDRIRRAVAELTVVFENLGPEHQALRAEEAETSAKERRGTVTRMGEGVAQAARTVVVTIEELATVHGLRSLGIDQQLSKDAEGRDYGHLQSLASPTQMLYNALSYLGEASTTLGSAYAPTKKNPGPAVARCPQQMKTALSSLRAALTAVSADIAEDDAEAAEEYTSCQTFLTQLEERVCRTVPAQRTGPSPEDVAAAIRADPEVARAALAALAART